MATVYPTTEHEVQEILVQFLREVPMKKHLWARADPGLITFWLLTEAISDADEERLFEANRRIYARVPEARFDFLVINPAMFADAKFRFTPPQGAEEIPLD